jgi:hypothetical protein
LLKQDFEKAFDRVDWGFMFKVLRLKGFDAGVVHIISQLVFGGQTTISINGGPFLAEALSVILPLACATGHL